MIEKEMEDLIAAYPNDFFPRKKLELVDRQKTFPGVGRFDLMFKDEFDTTILMELKARPAKYKDADQLAKYWNALTQQGQKGVIMWLVASAIPFSVRDFLDRIGIEYTEIHEAEFRRVAQRHGYTFNSEFIRNPINNDEIYTASLSESHQLNDHSTHSNLQEDIDIDMPIITDCGRWSDRLPHKIQSKFRKNREKLRSTFEVAYAFLRYPEVTWDSNLTLMTATNAHLYFRKCFLAYIKLGRDFIVFSPKYHLHIHNKAKNRPSLLFKELLPSLIEKHNGYEQKWARRNKIGIGKNGRPIFEYTFYNRTPIEFFDDLINALENLQNTSGE